ncbi:roadblock/LC7 domain-containing protein [Streptomyces sp. NPDC002755]|uniref:roadblock/LC7 domain-containing protein n=1 Tax=Streptomyces sp. NPDC002884 TaxID=3154544 RepID=UPI0033195C4E
MHDTRTSEPIVKVLNSLRNQVTGVSESVVSTADGLLVASDTEAAQPESIAALAAAALSLGRRMAQETDTGVLREVVTRSAEGHVVLLAVGDRAILTIIGDSGLDFTALHRDVPATLDRLARILAEDGAENATE